MNNIYKNNQQPLPTSETQQTLTTSRNHGVKGQLIWASQHVPSQRPPQTTADNSWASYVSQRSSEYFRDLYSEYQSQKKIVASQIDFKNQFYSGAKPNHKEAGKSKPKSAGKQKKVGSQIAKKIQKNQVQFITHSNYKMNPKTKYIKNVPSPIKYQVPHSQSVIEDIHPDVILKKSKRLTKLSQWSEIFLELVEIQLSEQIQRSQHMSSQNAIQVPVQYSVYKSESKFQWSLDNENAI